MISVLGFILFNFASYFLAFKRAPFWGLFAYMNIYFNPPNPRLNWWAENLPFDRWSLLTSAVLLLALFVHRNKLSDHKFENTRWAFIFFGLSAVIVMSGAVSQKIAQGYLYNLFTYCLIVYILLRTIKDSAQLRLFFLAIVAFAGNLSLNAYLYGERVNNRLEELGSTDANGSNEFALLLIAIIPIMFAFIRSGTRIERIISFVSMPFILNAFILCNSRGAAVAFLGAVFLAFIIVADKQIRKGVIILGLAITPVFLYLTDDEYIERFTTLLGFDSAMEDASAARKLSSGRTEIWNYGVAMVQDHPFGAGPQGFKELARFYMPDEVLTFRPGAAYGVRSAHNTYLQVLVEQGYIGLFIWIILCLHTLMILQRTFKKACLLEPDKLFWKDSTFAMSIAFFSILLGGLFNSRIYYEFFWWQLALAAIAYALISQMIQQGNSHDK